MARAGVQVGVAGTGQEGSSCGTESYRHGLITEETDPAPAVTCGTLQKSGYCCVPGQMGIWSTRG